MHKPSKPTPPIYGPAFARDMEQRKTQTPADSPYRNFDVHCVNCRSYQVRIHAEFNEAEGDVVLLLICGSCRQQERVRGSRWCSVVNYRIKREDRGMCNRVVQKDRVIKPGEKLTVLMKGPGAAFPLPAGGEGKGEGVHWIPFDDAVFAGPAKSESRNYWIRREGAVDVLVPDVSRFGEKNKTTGAQGWEDVAACIPSPCTGGEGQGEGVGTPSPRTGGEGRDEGVRYFLEGLLLPRPPGKDYRLLKIVTQPATPDQRARMGNDRVPIVRLLLSQDRGKASETA